MKVPEFLKVSRNPGPPRCHHTSDDGSPCNAPPQSGKMYCFFHDPRQQKKREAAHRNGGFMRNRRSQTEDHAPLLPSNPPQVSFKTFDDVGQFFEQVTNYVLQGQMDARTANCLRQLASGRLRVFEAKARAQRQKEEEAKAGAPSNQPRGSSGKKKPFSDLECHVTDLATGTVRIIKGGVTTVIPPQPRIPPDPPPPGDPYHHDEHASIESRAEASNARQRAVIDNWLAQERSRSNLNGTSGSKPLSPPAKPEPRPQSDAGPPRLETTATRTTTPAPTPVKTTLVETLKIEPPKPAAASVPPTPAAPPDKQAKYQHKPEPPGCPTHWRYWNE